ncbi:hypothetical protein LEP1GSC051_0611 [Leptospira sp. P2653]|nr:hypothetical protein LEP1GSC051_0611 [Leptospira sp. P2653]
MGFETLEKYFPVLKNRICFSPLWKRFEKFVFWSENSKKIRLFRKKIQAQTFLSRERVKITNQDGGEQEF